MNEVNGIGGMLQFIFHDSKDFYSISSLQTADYGCNKSKVQQSNTSLTIRSGIGF